MSLGTGLSPIVSARRLFEEIFPTANVNVDVCGNVLAAIAFLHGLATEELRQEELDYRDADYAGLHPWSERLNRTVVITDRSRWKMRNEIA